MQSISWQPSRLVDPQTARGATIRIYLTVRPVRLRRRTGRLSDCWVSSAPCVIEAVLTHASDARSGG